MHIGVVLGKFPAVSEQFLLTQITGLLDAGHEVTILATKRPRDRETSIVQPLFYEYELASQTRYVHIPRSKMLRRARMILLLAGLRLFRPKIAAAVAKMKRAAPQVSSYRLYLSAMKYRTLRFDVLHAHFGHNAFVGAFLKELGVAPRLVVSFHGFDVNSYVRRYGSSVYQSILPSVDFATANTEFTKNKAVACGFPSERVAIVPEGLRVENYPVRVRETKADRFVLLTVGRLTEKKGHTYVIDAVNRVNDAISGFEYRMVGDGPMRPLIEAKVDELGLRSVCSFVGAQPADVVRDELKSCDVFVLASVTAESGDMEGQAVVLQEAQAMGIPVISTLHNGIPDGVLDGESGFLVPEKDAEALAERILWFADNRDAIPKMGKAGASFVRKKYDVPVITQAIVEVYSRALGDGAG